MPKRRASKTLQQFAESSRKLMAVAHEHFFDRWYGVETRRRVEARELEFYDECRHANRYEPTPYIILHTLFRLIKRLNLQNARWIDYGCGKGRVLVVAKRFGIQKRVGIELDSRLLSQCRERKCGATLLQQDARVVLDLAGHATEPTVHFFFNPFEWPVLETVLQNIQSYSGTHYVVLVNPAYLEQIRPMGFEEVAVMDVSPSVYSVHILRRLRRP